MFNKKSIYLFSNNELSESRQVVMANQSRLKFVFKYKLLLIGYIQRLISGFFSCVDRVSSDVTLVPLLSLPNALWDKTRSF